MKKIFIRQLFASFFLGTIPFLLAFSQMTSTDSLIDVMEGMLLDEANQKYVSSAVLVYFLIWLFDKYIHVHDENARRRIREIKGMANEVASGIKSAIHAFIGVIFGFLIIWPAIEPQTITIPRIIGFLSIGALYLTAVSYIELAHEKMQK